MTDLRALCGLTVESALEILSRAGVRPEIVLTESPRHPSSGTARVLRVSEDGSVLTAALFPDVIREEATP
ncbi:MAG: hypothetical protein IJJ23_12250 [Clostridia bacterium]|nr:hypothetical protein [Clostridia bacterium]